MSEGEERVKEVSEELYKKMLEYRAPVISEAMKLIAMGEDVDMQKLIDEADAKAEQDYENSNSSKVG